MGELIKQDFCTDMMKLDVCFENKHILNNIKIKSLYKNSLTKVKEVYGTDLFFPAPPETRPYLISSIVLSLDGKMGFEDNASGPLIAKNNWLDQNGALADFWQLQVLRAMSDGIIIGAKTLEVEVGTTSHIFDDELFYQREIILGKKGHPTNIIISLDGTDIPLDQKIFNVRDQQFRSIIATSPYGWEHLKATSDTSLEIIGPFNSESDIDKSGIRDRLAIKNETIPVIVTGTKNKPDSDLLMYILRCAGMETLLIESPTFTGYCMQQGILDEAFICYSFLIAGGNVSPNTAIPFNSEIHPHAELLMLAVHEANFLYSRQRIIYKVDSVT